MAVGYLTTSVVASERSGIPLLNKCQLSFSTQDTRKLCCIPSANSPPRFELNTVASCINKDPSPPAYPQFSCSSTALLWSEAVAASSTVSHVRSDVAAGRQIFWLPFISSFRLLLRGRNPLLRRNVDLRLTMTIWLESWKITLMSLLANSDWLNFEANRRFSTGFLPRRLSDCLQEDWLCIVMCFLHPSDCRDGADQFKSKFELLNLEFNLIS